MNTRLISTAAVALALVAGQAFAAPDSVDTLPTLTAHSAGKTRAEVKAELAAAQREGSVNNEGEGGAWIADAPVVHASGKSRAAVKAELANAVRVGAIPSANTPY